MNHFKRLPDTPAALSSGINPACQTRSNAFLMLQNTTRTSFPESKK